jgi:hypothetical protein
MYDLVSLMEQHDRLDALADQLVAQARNHGSPAADCAAVLTEMEAILSTHLSAEAEFLYDKARADNDNEFAATLADFEQDFSLLDEHWHQFVRDWTVEWIEANRAGFQSQASDIMTALKLRIARENAVLYPMALEQGRIALRPGA